jgi:hypothetical protein
MYTMHRPHGETYMYRIWLRKPFAMQPFNPWGPELNVQCDLHRTSILTGPAQQQ